jgi:hypothetical protein
MTPSDVMNSLLRAGHRLVADGNAIRVQSNGESLTDELRQQIREHKGEILRILGGDAPAPEPPAYFYPCPGCDGTNWRQVGTLPDGGEVWGCLDCSGGKQLGSTCPECGGENLVIDSVSKYCIDCLRRPWERKSAESASEPK